MLVCGCHLLEKKPKAASDASASAAPAAAKPEAVHPIDDRITVAAKKFKQQDDGSWQTSAIKPEFAFDELIYSWDLYVEENQGFRVFLRVTSVDGEVSPWLYGGCWGRIEWGEKRKEPEFAWGKVAMDQVLLTRKAKAVEFKIVDVGLSPLKRAPSFTLVATDNSPSAALCKKYTPAPGKPAPVRILDLPIRAQADSKGTPMPNRCQSAALATAMEYYQHPVGLEHIVPLCFDVEYDFPGIWPRTIAAGGQNGFTGYIDRFRNWDDVRKVVAENKVILCSIRMPKGDYKAPPYDSIGGHIVALNGVTTDGRVIVTDSALVKKGQGYCVQWLQEDFEKIWMQQKGGVGMVICPPPNAPMKLITDLPPFPTDRKSTTAPAEKTGS